jgi:hypothetical protein
LPSWKSNEASDLAGGRTIERAAGCHFEITLDDRPMPVSAPVRAPLGQ